MTPSQTKQALYTQSRKAWREANNIKSASVKMAAFIVRKEAT